METIKDLQDKLSLVLWVNRNLGKLCEFTGLNSEEEEVLQMGRIIGYNVETSDCAVVIIERFKNKDGWTHISAGDMIMFSPFESSSFAYKSLNKINIIV